MESKSIIRGRFAPSPSGRMHLGNLFAALLAWLDVRSLGGEMLLRLEDLDTARCRRVYASQLAEDLRWLGLDWDVGWSEEAPQFAQSNRTACYQEALEKLGDLGLLYPCWCSRKELLAASAPHETDGNRVYSGRCRLLSAQKKAALEESGRAPAWRIRVPEEEFTFTDENYGHCQENLARDCGDFIVRRSDGIYAYQLAVAVDDGRMGITRVVRGRDLLSSTPRQIWLMRQLGYSAPVYGHVPLLLGDGTRRLSKRDRDLDMGVLRERYTPQKVLGFLGCLAGLLDRPEPVTARELIPLFSWEQVGTRDRLVENDWLLLHQLGQQGL